MHRRFDFSTALIVVGLTVIGPSICQAAINAKALLSLPGGSLVGGEYTASTSHTHVIPGVSTAHASMSVGSGSTDQVISGYASINAAGGDNQTVVESLGVYRDTLYVAGGAPLSQIFLRIGVDADFSVPDLHSFQFFGQRYGYGQAGIDFMAGNAGLDDPSFNPLGYPQYATGAHIYVDDDVSQAGLQRQTRTDATPTAWDSYQFVTDPFDPTVIHFNGERIIALNYDPNLGGFRYGAFLRVQAIAFNASTIADVGNTVSLVDVTDANGNRLQDLGYSVTFQSGMTFPQAAAVPEPTSFAIWGFVGTSLALVVARRRRNHS